MRIRRAIASVLVLGVLASSAAPAVAGGAVFVDTVTLSSGQTFTFQPSLSGELVVWMQQTGVADPYTVQVRRPDGTLRQVSTAGKQVNALQGPAAFGGRWVVWSQMADNGAGGEQFNLMAYDNVSDSISQLTHSTVPQTCPAGNGMTLVWVSQNAPDALMTATMPGLSSPGEVRSIPGEIIRNTCIYGSKAGYTIAPSATPALTEYISEDVYTHDAHTIAADDGLHGPNLTSMGDLWWTWDQLVSGDYRVFAKSRVTDLDLDIPGNAQDPSVYSNCIAYGAGSSGNVFVWEALRGVAHQASGGGDTRYVGFLGRGVAFTQRNSGTWGVKLTTFRVVPDRIAGSDRYAVAVGAARASAPSGWTGVGTVVVASGDDAAAADPLAAAGLCWKYDAPLLLVSKKAMPASTLAALQEIKAANPAAKVIVVGGAGSVPESRVTQMKAVFGAANVERLLATGDRYDLAAKIAERMRVGPGGRPFSADPVALIANGADSSKFFDALALSAVARANGSPILLVKATSAPAATLSALVAMDPQGVAVAGGTGSVSAATYIAVGGTTRLAGPDRYATARAIAEAAIENGYAIPSEVALTAKLPDGVSGGAMVGAHRGVLLVTQGTALPTATREFVTGNYPDLWECTVLGGTGSVSTGVMTQLTTALNP